MTHRPNNHRLMLAALVTIGLLVNAPAAAEFNSDAGCGRAVGSLSSGPALTAGISGDLAVFTEGADFVVIDISDPTAPVERGRVTLAGVGVEMVVSGDVAWLACGAAGLIAVSFSDPSSPVVASTTEVDGLAQHLAIEGETAALGVSVTSLVAWDSDVVEEVELIDVGDPAAPVRSGRFTVSQVLPAEYWASTAYDLAVTETHVFIAGEIRSNDGRKYTVLLISRADHSLASIVDFDDSSFRPRSIATVGTTLIAASPFKVWTIDVSNPSAPTALGATDLEFTSQPYYAIGPIVADELTGWLWIPNSRQTLGASSTEVAIVDVRDPAAPSSAGSFEIPGSPPPGTYDIVADHQPVAGAVLGTTLLIAGASGGLHVFDSTSPESPTLQSTVDVTDRTDILAAEGDVGLVAGSGLAARVLDLSDPAAPHAIAEIDMEVAGVDVEGGYGYVAGARETRTETGLAVFDLSIPASPTEVAWIDLPKAHDIEVVGPIAYVQSDQLYVYDVTEPANPELVSTTDIEVRDLVVGDGWGGAVGAAGANEHRLHALDLTDPWNPTLIRVQYYIDRGPRPAILGDVLYGAEFDALKAYDSQGRFLRDDQVLFQWAGGVQAVGSWLVAGESGRGIRVFDTLDPKWPFKTDIVPAAGLANEMEDLGGGLVAAAMGDGGVVMFDISACDPLASTILVDVAASAEGSNDSVWSSDLEITNGGTKPAHVQIRFLPQNTDNSDVAFDLQRTEVSPLFTWRYADVWGQHVGTGAGAIQIRTNRRDAVAVSSRTFNTGADGTFGQGIPGLISDELFKFGERARIIRMAQTPRYRGNLGLVNASDAAINLVVEYYGGDGTLLGSENVALAALSSTQFNRAFLRVIDDEVEVGYIDVSTTTPDGVFTAYGSVVDNQTSDPTTLLPLRGGGLFVVAGAAASGAHDSQWTTELEINNQSDQQVTYRLRLVPQGEAGEQGVVTDQFTLAAGASVRYADAWGEFAGSGAGSIEVLCDEPDALLVMTRTFNTSDAGTFGQGIAGISPADWFGDGESATVGQLSQAGRFRSNLVFANGADHAISLKVAFYKQDGTHFGDLYTPLIEPGGTLQWNEAFRRATGENVLSGFVVVTPATPDSLFYVIGSKVDGGTGDPTTIVPR